MPSKAEEKVYIFRNTHAARALEMRLARLMREREVPRMVLRCELEQQPRRGRGGRSG